MTPFSLALNLFDEFVAMSPETRAARLDALQQQDAATHEALTALLASDDVLHASGGRDRVLDSPPEALLARHGTDERTLPDPRVGARLGPWRIERIIGTGGMGSVYEAWRDDGQYRQRVALKCIRVEMMSDRLQERFRREREILAGLDHPGIATLFDGGIDAEGSPWFAMRYVEGVPLDEWCDQRTLDLRARVALLVRACDAIAHAHRHMVLHQDIKPSNLLVTEDGQLQLLDFGLAASLSVVEQTPRIAVSVGYTAPEAIDGAPPATTMDIWSLGMMMYRLLCGSLPPSASLLLGRDLGDKPIVTMSRLATEAGDAIARHRGASDVAALGRQLAGDLDAIAARCIAHLPTERYPSVTALRDDLERWLQRRPVDARQGGTLYRARRFVRRHRTAMLLAAVAGIALAGGGGFALWHSQRAAQEAQSAAALAKIFEQTLGAATLSGLSDAPLSSLTLLEETEQRIRSLSLQAHPAVLARGLSMLARNLALIGHYPRATALAEEAAALQGNDPKALAGTQATLASLLNTQGRHAEALKVAQQALSLFDDDSIAPETLPLLVQVARSQWDMTRRDAAEATLDKALTLAQRVRDPLAQAELLNVRGYWHLRQFRFAEAEADAQQAIQLAMPNAPLVANEARGILVRVLLQQDRTDEGRRNVEQLLADYRSRLGDKHPLTGSAWALLANLQCSGGQFAACEDALEEAERIILKHYGEHHPEYANLLRIRSLLSSFRGETPRSNIDYLRQSEAISRAFYPPSHETVVRARAMLARRLMIASDASPEGRRRLDEAIALYSTIEPDSENSLPILPIFTISLASALSLRNGDGDLERARALLERNRTTLAHFPPGYNALFYNEYMLAILHLRAGEHEQADVLLAPLEDGLRQHQETTNHRMLLRMVFTQRAAVAQRRGDRVQAREWLVKARDQALAAFGPTHQSVRLTTQHLEALDRTGRFQPPAE